MSLPSSPIVMGQAHRLPPQVSDFKVIIRDQAGQETTLTRSKGEPSVALTDRLQHHLDLLEVYRDVDIHNLTAYLATLK